MADADLSKYFDTVPHCELMQCVAQRIVDRDVLRLIKMWLTAPVEERGASRGHPSTIRKTGLISWDLSSPTETRHSRQTRVKLLIPLA